MTKQEFARRWEASREKIYRFAYCYVKNEHDAMEILSEANYRGFCALGTLREPACFDSWMCSILMRCAYSFLKQHNRFVPYEDTLLAETEPNDALREPIAVCYEVPQDFLAMNHYYYNYVDLNGDGTDEVFAVGFGSYLSGSGLLLSQGEDGLKVLQKFTLVNNPCYRLRR